MNDRHDSRETVIESTIKADTPKQGPPGGSHGKRKARACSVGFFAFLLQMVSPVSFMVNFPSKVHPMADAI